MKLRLFGYDVFIKKATKRIGLHKLLEKISWLTNISVEEISGTYRGAEVVRARMFYFKIARMNGYTYKEIGKLVGKDHSTVVHHIQKLDDLTDKKNNYYDEYLDYQLAELLESL